MYGGDIQIWERCQCLYTMQGWQAAFARFPTKYAHTVVGEICARYYHVTAKELLQ